jgi:hypothetical protein
VPKDRGGFDGFDSDMPPDDGRFDGAEPPFGGGSDAFRVDAADDAHVAAAFAVARSRRTLVVANKSWEADPLVAVLSSKRSRPESVTFTPSTGKPGLRGIALGPGGAVEIWCLQELMDPKVSSSSTEEKARVLPALVGAAEVAMVVAFGTAATPGPDSLNGCVVIGTRAFVHDPKSPSSTSHWPPTAPDRLQTSPAAEERFGALTGPDFRLPVEARLLAPPLNPAPARVVLAAANYVALSDVNITDYADYAWADEETVDAFVASRSRSPIGSLETTHGVIRSYTTVPFMFVSGITDRIGAFNAEVSPREYAQNFAAAHNAGVAVAYLIPTLPPPVGPP